MISRKILIIGADGMLGNDVSKEFPDAELSTIGDLDITKRSEVFERIRKLDPDVVINCAAYTAVDAAEDNEALCMDVNAEAAGYIAEACEMQDAVMVQISTDYAFDGNKGSPYLESDETNPLSVYGKSKALGEELVTRNCKKHYVIRTAWLFGRYGKNFVETMLRLSSEKDELTVVDDQSGSPTYTKDLAKKIREIVETGPAFGTYHVTNSGEATWFDFAREIVRLAGKEKSVKVTAIKTVDLKQKAQRPEYSVMLNTKTSALRHWKDALKDYMDERNKEGR